MVQDVRPITEKEYYKMQYSSAEVSGNVTEHKVVANENIWNIARKQLPKGAKRGEVLNYVYQIAKLNNKSSMEELSKLAIGDVLLLPATNDSNAGSAATAKAQAAKKPQQKAQTAAARTSAAPKSPATAAPKKNAPAKTAAKPAQKKPAPAVKKQQAAVPKTSREMSVQETAAQINRIIALSGKGISYTTQKIYKLQNINKISPELYAAHGQAGAKYWIEQLQKNPKEAHIFTENTYSGTDKNGVYILQKDGNIKMKDKTVATIIARKDKAGNFEEIAFSSPGAKIHDIVFDYKIDSKGYLYRPDRNNQYYMIDKVPPQVFENLKSALSPYMK